MDSFPLYFSSTAVKDTLLPFLFSCLKDGAATIRRRCAFLIASSASQLHNSVLTSDVFQRAHSELRHSPNCYLRVSLSLIHISEPTRLLSISYAVFCLKKKKRNNNRAQAQELSDRYKMKKANTEIHKTKTKVTKDLSKSRR
eukprot:TRINITY_DN39907_c0_g2_i1.p1 TRINITY_DN39907_c0_g2~~TRINITY_DN39907_c0_g2_i1.p1  ORF type:complete len:142 (+),score=16.06 TRINITY_DN39907_c0_g2_i1:145-570(+)